MAGLNTSSVIAIGDLQGCYESLEGLLEQLPDTAPLIFMGDLVNRGPQSLETLRRVKELQESGRAQCLLGNHDLHLLAVASGVVTTFQRQWKIDTSPAYDIRVVSFPRLL